MKKYLFLIFLTLNLTLITLCACNLKEVEQPQDTAAEYYKIVYLSTDGGVVSGNTEQLIEYGYDAQQVIAVPNDGYKFVKWSDGITTTERQDKNITSDISVKAEFKKKQSEPSPIKFYNVSYIADIGGYIEGNAVQSIEQYESSEKIVAVPDTGYRFVKWSDGVLTPERQENNVWADKTVIAIFEKLTFTVRYECDFGMLEITTASGKGYAGPYVDFEVKYGENCEKIISVGLGLQNYIFVGWSDGIDEQKRQELNVTSDIVIKAKFGFELKYKVDDGKGGRIIGDCRQLIEDGGDSQPVEAVADSGYVFSGWSDTVMDATHQVKKLTSSLEYVAYFEPITKTFKYDYGTGVGVPLKTDITLTRYDLNNAQFEIPQRTDYVFRGWYADNNYKLKVVHESGKLMLGLQTLNLETDTLYAGWVKAGEEKKTYKILMIMVDEVYATLYSTKIEQDILIDYKMSGIERKLCSVIPSKLSQYLNKWFDGKVIFELDTYYTREVAGNDCFTSGVDSTKHTSYEIYGDKIAEINDIINEYECTVLTYSMEDYDVLLRNDAGLGKPGHAMVRLEDLLLGSRNVYPSQGVIESTIKYNGDGEVNEYFSGLQVIAGYLHEFCHTIEMRYVSNSPEFIEYTENIYGFHEFFCVNPLEDIRLYLTYQGVVDGRSVGVPPSYWEKFYNKGGVSEM